MKASLEIKEGKYIHSFEDEQEGLDSLGKLLSESINDYPFSLLPSSELSEFNFQTKKKNRSEIKDRILIQVIKEIEQELPNDDQKMIFFEPSIEKNLDDINKKTSNDIYNSINELVHKLLHGKKKLEEKKCYFLEKSCNNNIDKYKNQENDKEICNLKEKNKIFEFIVIKSLMISFTNYMTELINSYLSFYEKMVELSEKKIEEEKKKENEGITSEIEEQEDDIQKFNFDEIFNEIYNDFVNKCIICSELEDYFKYSLESFKNKYQINFSLSELFTDIFWNSIFHNKILCQLFIDSYTGYIYDDYEIDLGRIIKVIFDTNIPLKHQIVELLGLNQIESNEKNDLMTLIVNMKNKFHCEIVKSEKEKEKENYKQIKRIKETKEIKEIKDKEKNKEKEGENIINNTKEKNLEEENNKNNIKINENKEIINDNNKINLIKNKNEIKNDENIRCNIITANDIGIFKKEKMKAGSSFLAVDTKNNNVILGVENTINKNEIKEKENNSNINNDNEVPDLTHKTVDEIINYINDDKIVDKSSKGKRKKKSRKNKKAKKEEALAEQNKNEIEDNLILKFKEDLNNEFIYAGSITKIKPVISENWIKDILSKY